MFCCARDSVALDELCSSSENITGICADLGDKRETEAFLAEVKKRAGGADIVINNVGASPQGISSTWRMKIGKICIN